MTEQRYMGLDVGEKTIGVAISDPLGFTAQGITVIARQSLPKDLALLKKIIADYQVTALVVGLPLSLNNTLGPQADKVKYFVAKLQKEIPLPLEYADERFSTTLAERTLLAADVSRQKRRVVIDKMAAQIILQSFLDRMAYRAKGQTKEDVSATLTNPRP